MTEDTVNPKAVQLLERGIKALQNHNYKQAVNAFNSLLNKFPGEHALRDRAQLFIKACERETAAKPKAPADNDELIHRVVFHLNRREFEDARALLDKAKKKPSIKLETAYNFALYHALLDEEDEALDRLAEAVELDETCKFAARTESDFASLRELPRFKELVD